MSSDAGTIKVGIETEFVGSLGFNAMRRASRAMVIDVKRDLADLSKDVDKNLAAANKAGAAAMGQMREAYRKQLVQSRGVPYDVRQSVAQQIAAYPGAGGPMRVPQYDAVTGQIVRERAIRQAVQQQQRITQMSTQAAMAPLLPGFLGQIGERASVLQSRMVNQMGTQEMLGQMSVNAQNQKIRERASRDEQAAQLRYVREQQRAIRSLERPGTYLPMGSMITPDYHRQMTGANFGRMGVLPADLMQMARPGAIPPRLPGGGVPPALPPPANGFGASMGQGFISRALGSRAGTGFAVGGMGEAFMGGVGVAAGMMAFNALSGAFSTLVDKTKQVYVSSLQTASSMEQLTMRLNVLSSGQGKAKMAELLGLARELKVPFMPMAQTYAQLAGFGIQPGRGAMRNLMGYTMATGNMENLPMIGLAISQMQSKGKIEMQELRQLAERGIDWQTLATKGGFNFSGMNIGDLGKEFIAPEKFLPALFKGMGETADKGIAEYQKTWEAKIGEMKLSWFDFQQTLISSGFFDAMKGLLDQINALLKSPIVSQLAGAMGNAGTDAAIVAQGFLTPGKYQLSRTAGMALGGDFRGSWENFKEGLSAFEIWSKTPVLPPSSGVGASNPGDMGMHGKKSAFSPYDSKLKDFINDTSDKVFGVSPTRKKWMELQGMEGGGSPILWQNESARNAMSAADQERSSDQGLAQALFFTQEIAKPAIGSWVASLEDYFNKVAQSATEYSLKMKQATASMGGLYAGMAGDTVSAKYGVLQQGQQLLNAGVDKGRVMNWADLAMRDLVPGLNESKASAATYGTADFYRATFPTATDPKTRLQEESLSELQKILSQLKSSYDLDLRMATGLGVSDASTLITVEF